MRDFLEQPQPSTRGLQIEDDPVKDSTDFIPHFQYFEIETKDKTITELILELNKRIEARFNCKKVIFGAAYGFSEFRFAPEYKKYRELSQYLHKLSNWLYKKREFPRDLRRLIAKGANIYE